MFNEVYKKAHSEEQQLINSRTLANIDNLDSGTASKRSRDFTLPPDGSQDTTSTTQTTQSEINRQYQAKKKAKQSQQENINPKGNSGGGGGNSVGSSGGGGVTINQYFGKN